jgi:hypothetical protein
MQWVCNLCRRCVNRKCASAALGVCLELHRLCVSHASLEPFYRRVSTAECLGQGCAVSLSGSLCCPLVTR